MNHYYVNTQAQSNGDHEVHKGACRFLPAAEHRQYLGYFASDREALREAKKYYAQADGCFFCCPSIHTH